MLMIEFAPNQAINAASAASLRLRGQPVYERHEANVIDPDLPSTNESAAHDADPANPINDGAVRGKRLTWKQFEALTGRLRPVGARDKARAARSITVPPKQMKPVRQEPANDNRPTPVVPTTASTPDRIPLALRKSAPSAYRTLCALRELARPADMSDPAVKLAANDNRKAADDTGIGLDVRHKVNPGHGQLEDLCSAFADGMRSRVVVDCHGNVERFDGGVKFHKPFRASGEIVEIGGRSSHGRFFGMRFHRGALEAYAMNGKRVRPSYEQGDPRGTDDAELPRETTAIAAAHPALAEIDRADAWADFASRVPCVTARMLAVILNADNFQEVARAAGLAPTAHNGRRITEKMLAEAEKLLAA